MANDHQPGILAALLYPAVAGKTREQLRDELLTNPHVEPTRDSIASQVREEFEPSIARINASVAALVLADDLLTAKAYAELAKDVEGRRDELLTILYSPKTEQYIRDRWREAVTEAFENSGGDQAAPVAIPVLSLDDFKPPSFPPRNQWRRRTHLEWKQMAEGGMSFAQIAKKHQEVTGEKITRDAVRKAIRRLRKSPRPPAG